MNNLLKKKVVTIILNKFMHLAIQDILLTHKNL